ncbi:Endoglucanase [Meloidogyne graminicola]|uniref:Endoglucanase n=1 Tax=Meloidogyne graminicola TaxID=189291 RepID=A0A8S9ZF84_9BILA|nr:Endoglucanase [Meloidogyne graminicola]
MVMENNIQVIIMNQNILMQILQLHLSLKNDEGDDEECVCEDDENPNNGTNSVTKTPENNGGNVPGNNDPINCSIELRDKWTGGANLILNFVNNGNSKACAIKFTLELCPDFRNT